MKIYLAGPDVFLSDAADIGGRKQKICAQFGFEGLLPVDGEAQEGTAPSRSLRIFRGNLVIMEEADAIIANLTPFRGPSADPGTVFELGYMAGRGKCCIGYSNVTTPYFDRVHAYRALQRNIPGRPDIDEQQSVVEDFGLADNLMIVHALDQLSHPLVLPQRAPQDVWRDLTAFETCVRLIAARNVSFPKALQR